MNCLKVDQAGDGMALKEPSMASSSTSGVMTGGGAASMSAATTSASASASASVSGGGGRNIRSWSSSHVDSVGESTHSKNSLVCKAAWGLSLSMGHGLDRSDPTR